MSRAMFLFRPLEADGLHEPNPEALALRFQTSRLRVLSGDPLHVRNDTPKEHFVFLHDNIISNESSPHRGLPEGH